MSFHKIIYINLLLFNVILCGMNSDAFYSNNNSLNKNKRTYSQIEESLQWPDNFDEEEKWVATFPDPLYRFHGPDDNSKQTQHCKYCFKKFACASFLEHEQECEDKRTIFKTDTYQIQMELVGLPILHLNTTSLEKTIHKKILTRVECYEIVNKIFPSPIKNCKIACPMKDCSYTEPYILENKPQQPFIKHLTKIHGPGLEQIPCGFCKKIIHSHRLAYHYKRCRKLRKKLKNPFPLQQVSAASSNLNERTCIRYKNQILASITPQGALQAPRLKHENENVISQPNKITDDLEDNLVENSDQFFNFDEWLE